MDTILDNRDAVFFNLGKGCVLVTSFTGNLAGNLDHWQYFALQQNIFIFPLQPFSLQYENQNSYQAMSIYAKREKDNTYWLSSISRVMSSSRAP